jgi:predicted DNA-binding protein
MTNRLNRDELGRIKSDPNSYSKKVTIRVTKEMEAEIIAIANRLGANKAEWCRDAIEQAIRNSKEKA